MTRRDDQTVRVTGETGTYVGRLRGGVQEFLGIPYAAPTQRWQRATYPTTTPIDEILALQFGPSSIQPMSSIETASLGEQSEDCLSLNVWTRDTQTVGKPVLVFIHGGGGISGGSSDPLYHGDGFVRALPEGADAVVVTINYRLGLFGTLDLSIFDDYTDAYADSVNLWMRDQIAAFTWVRRNIAAFGGDRENVTLFGQSAGAAFISTHMTIPESRRLFRRAIVQSGGLTNRHITPAKAREIAHSIADTLGVRTLRELRALSADQIRDAITEHGGSSFGSGIFFPVADGKLIPLDPGAVLASGAAADIDLLIGFTNGERDTVAGRDDDPSVPTDDPAVIDATLERYSETVVGSATALTAAPGSAVRQRFLALYADRVRGLTDLCNDLNYRQGIENMAAIQSVVNANTYVYTFTWASPADQVIAAAGDAAEVSPYGRAVHAAELPFVFDKPEHLVEITGPADGVPNGLARRMIHAWFAFASNGNPTHPEIPTWTAYTSTTRAIMRIDAQWQIELDPFAPRREAIAPHVRPHPDPKESDQ